MQPAKRQTAAEEPADATVVASSAGSVARVLFVCTGNICRSPYAELLLRATLTAAGVDDVRVSSAGTDAVEDREIAGQIGATLRELGVESAGFRARQLTRSMLEKADLILTAERSHRALVVRMHPKALSRTFTIAQAGRMLKFVPTGPVLSSPLDRIAGLTHSLAAARGLAGPSSDHDDIADPWGESDAAYRRATSSIAPVVTQLASSLIPSRHSAR